MWYKTAKSACALQFSPLVPGLVAVATSDNFGIIGNGQVNVIQANATGFNLVASFDTLDGACSIPGGDRGASHVGHQRALMQDLGGRKVPTASDRLRQTGPPAKRRAMGMHCLEVAHHSNSHCHSEALQNLVHTT